MKTFIHILLLVLPTLLFGQLVDDNTLAINNYFQTGNIKPNANNASQLNADIRSYTNVTQGGNENKTYINSLQTGDQQTVDQKGDQNTYEYYNYYSTGDSNMIINQEGNQNSLQIFGENSLIKNAIINQKSNFKTLVIKNYTN